MESFAGVPASPNFSFIARHALAYLQRNVGLGMWMVTRVAGEDWVKLEVADRVYGEKSPSVSPWADSFCSQMVLGKGPRVAPSSAEVPAYEGAADNRKKKIGAYIGVPLVSHDGSLFGTLCAIDPQPQPESIRESLPLVELVATMLSGVLSAETRASELWRKAEQAHLESETDALTGLHNRRGWDRIVGLEEKRCERYGHPACVITLDLDGLKKVNDTEGHEAGDDYIRRGSLALRRGTRKLDVVARVGGDEFVALGIECEFADGQAMAVRIRQMLDQAGVKASLGIAKRAPTGSLFDAMNEADRSMYEEKRSKKLVCVKEAPVYQMG